MTATTRQPSLTLASGKSPGSLTGIRTLAGFMLRRDRITLPAWILGMTAFFYYFVAVLLPGIATTEEQLRDLERFMQGSVGAIFGPGYGRDAITIERYVTGVYGIFFFIGAALMSILLVARHTRADEQAGRAELVRSNPVGPQATLGAAMAVAAGANGLLALLFAGVLALNDYDAGAGLLFGASVGAVGLVFTGITALTVQLTEDSRAATGFAGAVLGAAWVIRAIGDMLRDYGSPLSWVSPLAWSHQTQPYVDGRWWPLLLSVTLALVTASAGYQLATRRDVGAGMIAVRPGPSRAATWLRTPLAATFRLQRASILWWTASLALTGFIFGAVSDQITDPDAISADRIDLFGGSLETLVDGYLGVITLFTVLIAGIMAVGGVQAARREETSGRAEPMLSTATSRTAWFGSYLLVLTFGLTGLLLIAGLTTGAGAALTTGNSAWVWRLTVAHLAHLPGVLVFPGIAAALFGFAPRAINAVWAALGYTLFAGTVGTVANLPDWARWIVPMEHTGNPPLDDIAWPAVALLLLVAIALASTGIAGFRRRDLDLS